MVQPWMGQLEEGQGDFLKATGQFTQIPRCGRASVASKNANTALVTPTPLSSPQWPQTTPVCSSEMCEGHTEWILSRLTTGRQCPPSPFPFPHQRCSGGQMQPQGNVDTHHVQRAQLQICSALFAFLVQLRNVSSPQKNQSEEHLYHIPVLCSTLLVALANWSTLFCFKTSVFSSSTPRYTAPPSFHQQTTVQTNRSSSHLSGT